MLIRRTTVTTAAATLLLVPMAASAAPAHVFRGDLVDLSATTADPFGDASGPHYNVSTATPPVVSDQTEVWLDFTVTTDGTGAGDASVPFVPVPGDRAVVVHAEETAPNGTAGARLVCLPVVW